MTKWIHHSSNLSVLRPSLDMGEYNSPLTKIMIRQNCSSQHLICKRSGWNMYCIWKIEYGSPATIYVITTPNSMTELAILSWPKVEIITVPMICSNNSCFSDLQIGFRSSASIWPGWYYGIWKWILMNYAVTYFSSETQLILLYVGNTLSWFNWNIKYKCSSCFDQEILLYTHYPSLLLV